MSELEESPFSIFTTLRFDPQLRNSNSENNHSQAARCRDENTRVNNNQRSAFYFLPYHRDRLLEAAKHFQWEKAIEILDGPEGLSKLTGILEENFNHRFLSDPLRVKILINSSGDIVIESGKTGPRPLPNLIPLELRPPLPVKTSERVPQTTEPFEVVLDKLQTAPTEWTRYKTTRRSMYEAARERAGIRDFLEPKEVLLVNPNNEIMEGTLMNVLFWRHGQWVTPPLTSGGLGGVVRRWLIEKKLVVEEAITVDQVVDGECCWLSNGLRGLVPGKIKLA